MAKTQLTPEEKAAIAAAKAEKAESEKQKAESEKQKAESEKQKAERNISARLKKAFEDFPTAAKLYHDGEEIFFYQTKPNMTVVKRTDIIKD